MKKLIRTVVVAAIVGWPTYEYIQYHQAKQALAQSVVLKKSVDEKLATARIKYAQGTPVNTAAVQR